jgi:SAM-dependent methyltransferase
MAKRTIVQLESFYPKFIQHLYARVPGLSQRPFLEQIQQLLDSGFSGGHNIVPFLDPSRWESHYIVLNCPWSQQAWAEAQGLPQGLSARDLLLAQLRHLRPDVLYLSDIPGFDFSILDELSERPLVMGWHATAVSQRTPWSSFDLVLSGIQAIRDAVRAQGAKAAIDFMPAAPPFRAIGRRFEPRADVVFSGSFHSGIHQQRALQFRQLSRAIAEVGLSIHTSQPFATDGEDRIRFRPAVFGHDVLSLYACHPIVLDSRGEFNLGDGQQARETSNMRVFEATRAGTLLLTERSPNLDRYFKLGEEIETYSSFDELVSKINFYASPQNEAARRRVAEAGLRRVRESHLIEHRAAWLEGILDTHLGSGTKPAPASPHEPARIEPSLAAQAFVLATRENSLIFALAQAEQVRRFHPAGDIYLLCLDRGAFDRAQDMKRPLQPISPQQLVEQMGAPAESLAALGDDLRAVACAMHHLFGQQEALQRLTYLGSDLVLTAPLPEGLEHSGTVVARYGLGNGFRPDDESLLTPASGFLSLGRPRPLASFFKLPDSPAPQAQQALNITALVQAATDAGKQVQTLVIDTPWQDADAKGSALAWLGPVSLIRNSQWQFVPFESAAGWKAYLNRVYIAHLQQVQAVCVEYAQLSTIGDHVLASSSGSLSRLLALHEHRTRSGYRMLSEDAYKAFSTQASGWDTPSVAATQHEAFKNLLREFRAGQQRADMAALTRIFARIAGPKTSVLEEGCGSGYNSELIRLAAGDEVRYSGVDIARSMIQLARQTYPGDRFEIMRSEQLDFPDGSFDVVLNGASLMHTIDYGQALAEARRVASRYVVLHTVTVADTRSHVHFEKNAYGSRVPEVCFSANELNRMLDANCLLPVQVEDSIDYNLAPAIGVTSRSLSIACFCLPAAEPRPNQYCTYFDANYLPRGLLMMRSLWRHDPNAVVHVLCLDDITVKALKGMGLPNVVPVPLTELLETDPEFASARENRSQIEWYFTATSCLVNHLMRKHPGTQRLIYLDSDLYFYASPAFLIDESREASVQIIEHRFSPHLANLVAFGRFNVGWIAFTNSDEGLRVIADYRRNCLEWCYDRLEGDRFGDQKYLDKWPQDYSRCCVSQVKGANVAWWNLQNAQLRRLGQRLYVGSDLLIFFHFQGIKRLENGTYATKRDPGEYGAYYELAYAPYAAELTSVDAEVRPLLEGFKIKDIRYQSW